MSGAGDGSILSLLSSDEWLKVSRRVRIMSTSATAKGEKAPAFLAAARSGAELLARREVAEHWDLPSALPYWSVRGLAGHLFRCAQSIDTYLDRSVAEGADLVDAVGYYERALASDDQNIETAPVHVDVRTRGEELAAGGHAALAEKMSRTIERLRERLAEEEPGRPVRVFNDIVLPLDEYLRTRIAELVVHTDDLAASCRLPAPEPPSDAANIAIALFVEMARRAHGDVAVLRALTRRERDHVDALRVL